MIVFIKQFMLTKRAVLKA